MFLEQTLKLWSSNRPWKQQLKTFRPRLKFTWPGAARVQGCETKNHRDCCVLHCHQKNGTERRGDKTNELTKSCGVLHVVTCREPAGLDQTPEAGSNTKAPAQHYKMIWTHYFRRIPKRFQGWQVKGGSKLQPFETERARSDWTPLPFSNDSYFLVIDFVVGDPI